MATKRKNVSKSKSKTLSKSNKVSSSRKHLIKSRKSGTKTRKMRGGVKGERWSKVKNKVSSWIGKKKSKAKITAPDVNKTSVAEFKEGKSGSKQAVSAPAVVAMKEETYVAKPEFVFDTKPPVVEPSKRETMAEFNARIRGIKTVVSQTPVKNISIENIIREAKEIFEANKKKKNSRRNNTKRVS